MFDPLSERLLELGVLRDRAVVISMSSGGMYNAPLETDRLNEQVRVELDPSVLPPSISENTGDSEDPDDDDSEETKGS